MIPSTPSSPSFDSPPLLTNVMLGHEPPHRPYGWNIGSINGIIMGYGCHYRFLDGRDGSLDIDYSHGRVDNKSLNKHACLIDGIFGL